MAWIDETLSLLESDRCWGYREGEDPACEPAALAGLACAAHGRHETARRIASWLAEQQATVGSVGVRHGVSDPHWPTGWAILAWSAVEGAAERPPFRAHVSRAASWLLTIGGKSLERTPEMGHDMSLVGWPWVEGTHSWLEPTAINVLALKASGEGQHARVREGVRLLFDRLLADGGCNYGNTRVFGQTLRPHLQPSGLALLALAGEEAPSDDERLSKTINEVANLLTPDSTAASLAYGVMGLAAHGASSPVQPEWLSHAAARTRVRGANLPRLSLLLLAERGSRGPLVTLPRKGEGRRDEGGGRKKRVIEASAQGGVR